MILITIYTVIFCRLIDLNIQYFVDLKYHVKYNMWMGDPLTFKLSCTIQELLTNPIHSNKF